MAPPTKTKRPPVLGVNGTTELRTYSTVRLRSMSWAWEHWHWSPR